MCHVVVVEVAGRLGDVVENLGKVIELALAEGHRGVICDLSAVLEGAEPAAIEVLASAGRHVRDWPGMPVAVACSNAGVSEALRAHHLGRHLIVTVSMFSALSAVLATPNLAVEWLRLAPHPNSPDLPRQRYARLDVIGRGLSLVGALSRGFGLLPTADGGKVVWVVLNAARPRPRIHRPQSRARHHPESPMFVPPTDRLQCCGNQGSHQIGVPHVAH